MLQKIRDGASGPLAYVVVGLIAVVFGVWGIGSYFTPSADPVVATAAGNKITQSELRRAFNQRYSQLRQMLGDNFDASQFPPSRIRDNVLQALIDQAVTTQYSQDAGYRVTDDELLGVIQSNQQFQDNGKFSIQRYKQVLSEAGLKPAAYEARLRESLLGSQLQSVVGAGAFAAPPEVDALYRQANAQRKVRYLTFDPSAYRDQVSVDASAVRAFYKAHTNQFMRPARVKLAYVALNANALSAGPVSEQTLKNLYQQHKDAFGTPAQRSAQVIRVPIQGGNDTAAREAIQKVAALAKAQSSHDSLASIASNVALAKFETFDSETQSQLPQAVGNALFKLTKGALSDPVHTDNAWYLLRLTGITPARHPGFNDAVVQNRLKAMADQQAVAKQFRSKAKTLSDLAYQAPNGLKTISNKLDLPIQTTGWISANAGGSGIGQYKAVRQAAFSDSVLKDNLNSTVINLGSQRQIVLRVTDHEKAEPKPLSAVADQIRQRLVAQKAQSKAYAAAKAAMAKLTGSDKTSLEAIAHGNAGVKLSDPGWIGNGDSNLASAIVTAAFAIPRSEAQKDGAPAYTAIQTDDGKAALVAVEGQRIEQSGDKKQARQDRQQMTQQQTQYNATLEYAALDTYLRDQADVKIKKDSLQQAGSDDGSGS